jgi:hypothetical protein
MQKYNGRNYFMLNIQFKTLSETFIWKQEGGYSQSWRNTDMKD